MHGHDDVARQAYEEGRELTAAAGDQAHLAMFLGNLSFLADHRGDYAEARRLCRQAIRIGWSLGRRMLAVWVIAEQAGAELGLGRPELGARLLGAADEALEVLDARWNPCDVPEHSRILDALNEVLGEPNCRLLRAEGAQLSLDQAVALALADQPDPRYLSPPHTTDESLQLATSVSARPT